MSKKSDWEEWKDDVKKLGWLGWVIITISYIILFYIIGFVTVSTLGMLINQIDFNNQLSTTVWFMVLGGILYYIYRVIDSSESSDNAIK